MVSMDFCSTGSMLMGCSHLFPQRELSGQLARTGCFAPGFLLMQEISAAFHINEEAPGLRAGFGLSLESRWRAAGDFWWLNLPCKELQISAHSLWWGQCASELCWARWAGLQKGREVQL